MIYVGIDIAKENHFAIVMTELQKVLVKPFGFENNMNGFQSLNDILKCYDKSDMIVGMESTAHYAEALISFLSNNGFSVALINPLQTSAIRNSAIRKAKNDRIDTQLIVKSMLVNGYRVLKHSDIQLIYLKSLERFRNKLKKSIAQQKIRLRSVMDMIFPELQYFFSSGLHIRTCYELLKLHTSPEEISSLHLTYLTNLLKRASNSAFGKEQAVELRKLAKNSVGIKSKIICLEARQLIEQIELLEKQCDEIEKNVSEILTDIDSVIKTIPRIGSNNTAMIISEFGDLTRFQNSKQMTAYAGLDAAINQSGKFNASSTRMSKRGSKYLRFALLNAAFQLTKTNQTFKDYYDKKRSEGKCHYNALGHTAHKLIRVIFHITKNNIAFSLP